MFSDWSHVFSSPFIIPVVAIIAGCCIPIFSIWKEMEKHKHECQLKRRMVERGMSADEIERVLAAQVPHDERQHLA